VSAVWALCFGQLWALAVDALFVQPRRRLQAARRGSDYHPGSISFALRASFPLVLGLLITRAFVLDVFHVPTESMIPALQPGERIWVDRLAYGLRWPLSGVALSGSTLPRRGDVVVFRYPREPSTAYVKRVIALPGDRIVIDGRRIDLNGRPLVRSWTVERGVVTQSVELDGTSFDVRADFARPAAPVALDLVVPAGHLFVMGDNQDHSEDSRHWGLVAEQHLMGRVKN
jgi:signal peptidase I